jgi:hypothetical protein
MGRIRRGGYTFIWWIGDHSPRHVHVFDKNGRLVSRVNLETLQPMDTLKIDRRVVDLIRQLQDEHHL